MDEEMRARGQPGVTWDDTESFVMQHKPSGAPALLADAAVCCVAADLVARLNGHVFGYKGMHALIIPRK